MQSCDQHCSTQDETGSKAAVEQLSQHVPPCVRRRRRRPRRRRRRRNARMALECPPLAAHQLEELGWVGGAGAQPIGRGGRRPTIRPRTAPAPCREGGGGALREAGSAPARRPNHVELELPSRRAAGGGGGRCWRCVMAAAHHPLVRSGWVTEARTPSCSAPAALRRLTW
jgi:hypothetical protein